MALILFLVNQCALHTILNSESGPLQYANFVLQAKNAANKATDGCERNFEAGCLEA